MLLAFILLAPSCQDDGGNSKTDLIYGALPDIKKTIGTDSFIDLDLVTTGGNINLGITSKIAIGKEEVSSIDIVGYYAKKGGPVYKAIFQTNITTFPVNIIINQADIINSFSEINSTSDFAIGDVFTVSSIVTLKNGRVINILKDDATNNFSPDIASSQSYKLSQSFNVSCSSNIGGTYNVLSSGTSADDGPNTGENPITNHPYTVTLIDEGGGNYTLSDAYGGLYILWYDIYGITTDNPGSISDICGSLSGSFNEPFGSPVTMTGVINQDGTLSLHWENGYGDFGDSVYTKVN